MNIIITINDINNYGNQLQNYALQTTLLDYSKTLTMTMHVNRNSLVDKYIDAIKRFRRCLLVCISSIPNYGAPYVRMKNFSAFWKKRILHSGIELSVLTVSEIKEKEQHGLRYVIGSDQVWNYHWLGKDDLRLRLGMFAQPSSLITYAASIGVDEIDKEWRPIFREGWSRIPHISVREDRAAELIKKISGREVAVVLDPTLMLTAEQWSELFVGFVPEGDRYVLTYFLGRPTDSQEEVIQRLAASRGLRIRRLNDLRDAETYSAGPAEFAELFAKASYVFTDSYHACCFSILNNVPFKVFNRRGFEGSASMNSRMRTLFRLFDLDDLMVEEGKLSEFDWPYINKLLKRHRAASRGWLEGALEDGPVRRSAC